jgi:metal-responsive CopG/Arc/MetJ family transcriptional regulator
MKAGLAKRVNAVIKPDKSAKGRDAKKIALPRSKNERVLIEFSPSLLERADAAARKLETNRSELIRTAVEELLESMETTSFNRELAEGYAANAALARTLAEEFEIVDREGF